MWGLIDWGMAWEAPGPKGHDPLCGLRWQKENCSQAPSSSTSPSSRMSEVPSTTRHHRLPFHSFLSGLCWDLCGGPSCLCLPATNQSCLLGPGNYEWGPPRAQPGAGAMQSPVRPRACSPSMVSLLYSAQQANANLGSLAITMRKTTQGSCSQLHPDLMAGPIGLWDGWRLAMTSGRGESPYEDPGRHF